MGKSYNIDKVGTMIINDKMKSFENFLLFQPGNSMSFDDKEDKLHMKLLDQEIMFDTSNKPIYDGDELSTLVLRRTFGLDKGVKVEKQPLITMYSSVEKFELVGVYEVGGDWSILNRIEVDESGNDTLGSKETFTVNKVFTTYGIDGGLILVLCDTKEYGNIVCCVARSFSDPAYKKAVEKFKPGTTHSLIMRHLDSTPCVVMVNNSKEVDAIVYTEWLALEI